MGQQGQLVLRLQAGERRQVLVEAGSGLLVSLVVSLILWWLRK